MLVEAVPVTRMVNLVVLGVLVIWYSPSTVMPANVVAPVRVTKSPTKAPLAKEVVTSTVVLPPEFVAVSVRRGLLGSVTVERIGVISNYVVPYVT